MHYEDYVKQRVSPLLTSAPSPTPKTPSLDLAPSLLPEDAISFKEILLLPPRSRNQKTSPTHDPKLQSYLPSAQGSFLLSFAWVLGHHITRHQTATFFLLDLELSSPMKLTPTPNVMPYLLKLAAMHFTE